MTSLSKRAPRKLLGRLSIRLPTRFLRSPRMPSRFLRRLSRRVPRRAPRLLKRR